MPVRSRSRPSHRQRKRLLVLSVIALLGSAFPVAAAPGPFADLGVIGEVVSDDELGEMRGKFISPEAVSYFGIAMLTSWQDAAGVTTYARLAFSADFRNPGSDGQPQVMLLVGWNRDGDPAMDVTNSNSGYTPLLVAAPVGGLDTTWGAAQANIIAGSDNIARNGLQVALVPTSALPTLGTDGLSAITSTTTFGFPDGDGLEFRLGENQIAMVVTGNNGLDSTLQSIGGSPAQILQQTVLNSDGNGVFNGASVVLGSDSIPGTFSAMRVNEALGTLKGNGF